MILFFKIFFTEFIAEMGDKTQLMLIALTSKHKLKDIILGTAAAILVLNGLAVLAGGLVSEFIPDWLIKTAAALAFLYFAASTVISPPTAIAAAPPIINRILSGTEISLISSSEAPSISTFLPSLLAFNATLIM